MCYILCMVITSVYFVLGVQGVIGGRSAPFSGYDKGVDPPCAVGHRGLGATPSK
jgi:hypothetical protein